jgi:predicted transcriptional regulator
MNAYTAAIDIANLQIQFIDGLASVAEAAQMMRDKNVEALFVEKRNTADAQGIVTNTDILLKVVALDKKLSDLSVYEIMNKPCISIPADMNVRYIPRLFAKAGIRIAPVEQGGKYLGYVGYIQLMAHFSK